MLHERDILDQLMPGLDDKLAAHDRADLEAPGGPGLDLFRSADGPGLVVPRASGGRGASAVQAVAVQVAIGARSGSLAVGTTMHHFSLASLIALAATSESGLESVLVEAIATQRHLLASGFAEGQPDAGVLAPTMSARPVDGGVLVSGAKKPCSLARSMTMLTASVALAGDGGPQMAVVLVPADSAGLSVEPFWASPALAAAESEAVVLRDVFVPEQLLVRTAMAPGGSLDATHRIGFLWFELLMTASYLGIAAGLVEDAFAAARTPQASLVSAWAQVRTSLHALSALAAMVDEGRSDEKLLAEVLLARLQLQAGLPAVGGGCLEALGGMGFITSPDLAVRVSSLSCLAFHPPSRHRLVAALDGFHRGNPLTFG